MRLDSGENRPDTAWVGSSNRRGHRRGRKRKTGKRTASGALARGPAESALDRALAMPHRSDLGAAALDQRAATELGRLRLIGEASEKAEAGGGITDAQYLAGQDYEECVRRYLASIEAPASSPRSVNLEGLVVGGGAEIAPEEAHRRAERYRLAKAALGAAGWAAEWAVTYVVLRDEAVPADQLPELRRGLDALAVHFRGRPAAGRIRAVTSPSIVPEDDADRVSGARSEDQEPAT